MFELFTLPSQYNIGSTLPCSPINDIQSQFSHRRQLNAYSITLSGSLNLHTRIPAGRPRACPVHVTITPIALPPITDAYVICLSTCRSCSSCMTLKIGNIILQKVRNHIHNSTAQKTSTFSNTSEVKVKVNFPL